MFIAMLNWVALCLFAVGEPDAIDISARIDAEALTPGKSAAILLEYKLGEGYEFSEDGMPRPIVQVDVPDSVELVGEELTDHKKLAKNEFLHAPFEFAMDTPQARIEFKVTSAPEPDDRIALNFIGYLHNTKRETTNANPQADVFIRRRLELSVSGGAVGVSVDPIKSTWGKDQFLDIGDEAPDFELPRADGSKVHLADFRGKQNVIVTTYRAFW